MAGPSRFQNGRLRFGLRLRRWPPFVIQPRQPQTPEGHLVSVRRCGRRGRLVYHHRSPRPSMMIPVRLRRIGDGFHRRSGFGCLLVGRGSPQAQDIEPAGHLWNRHGSRWDALAGAAGCSGRVSSWLARPPPTGHRFGFWDGHRRRRRIGRHIRPLATRIHPTRAGLVQTVLTAPARRRHASSTTAATRCHVHSLRVRGSRHIGNVPAYISGAIQTRGVRLVDGV